MDGNVIELQDADGSRCLDTAAQLAYVATGVIVGIGVVHERSAFPQCQRRVPILPVALQKGIHASVSCRLRLGNPLLKVPWAPGTCFSR